MGRVWVYLGFLEVYWFFGRDLSTICHVFFFSCRFTGRIWGGLSVFFVWFDGGWFFGLKDFGFMVNWPVSGSFFGLIDAVSIWFLRFSWISVWFKSEFSSVSVLKLKLVWFDFGFNRSNNCNRFQSSFRAASEQFASNFRTILEQF